jgi:hypothetical protein
MRTVRYIVAAFSLILGGGVLLFSLLQSERSALGIALGALLLLYGLLKFYVGA